MMPPAVNANEAECRRGERFVPFGSTTGPVATPPMEENPQFPLTLDLRRPLADLWGSQSWQPGLAAPRQLYNVRREYR